MLRRDNEEFIFLFFNQMDVKKCKKMMDVFNIS